ncbi:MAG TPA: prepilin-type N-terminal cleavage/methylation domain-containing protein [Solirubrobacteraceae bacterium]|nr:prepilin-type N-terminal cleavage/methylation domain-containing protein [Solirubrobacteraceae bacterium]
MPLRTRIADDGGFTIVEVMVAMVILLIGVLGTVVLVEGSMSSTSRTTAREQGTNLARDLVERSRQATYTSITADGAGPVLAATLPSSEVTGAGGSTFTVTRRGVAYTVAVSACAVDDPTDGPGTGTAAHCVVGSGGGGGSSVTPPPISVGDVRVLGVDVSVAAGGSLLQTVCNAVGTNTDIAGALSAAVSPVAAVAVCPAGSAGAGSAIPVDSDPDDMRQVRIAVSWTRGVDGSVTQTTLLANPSQN